MLTLQDKILPVIFFNVDIDKDICIIIIAILTKIELIEIDIEVDEESRYLLQVFFCP